jgi:hypothetical protein
MPARIIWAVVAIAFLLLIIAPVASYCLGRDQDYRENGGFTAPRPPNNTSAVVTGPLIR